MFDLFRTHASLLKLVPRGIGFFRAEEQEPKRIRISAVFRVPYVHELKIGTYGTLEMELILIRA